MPDKPRIGIYPGTFDPITRGHMDIIRRAARLVDRLVVGVAAHSSKSCLFPVSDRVSMIERELAAAPKEAFAHVSVQGFDTLLMHFAKETNASVIIRGLRLVSDFDYEIQMAAMNYRMFPDIETVFLTAAEGSQFVASSFVKEIARLGGDVTPFVSPAVAQDIERRFAQAK